MLPNRDVKPANIIRPDFGKITRSKVSDTDLGSFRPQNSNTNIANTESGLTGFKLVDFGTAIGLKENQSQVQTEASASLQTFTELQFAG